MHIRHLFLTALILFLLTEPLVGQSPQEKQYSGWNRFWTPSDTFHPARFWIAAASGSAIYAVTMTGLNKTWYRKYPRSDFHLHNDWGEWRHMDKLGHAFTTYTESRILDQGAQWTGMNTKTSRWLGSGVALGLQTSLEILDGHSSQWGFSWPDMAFNVLGAGIYLSQDMIWQEQRVSLKVSNWLPAYPEAPMAQLGGTSLKQRSRDLFGSAWTERYLKDYNAQTIWLSVSPDKFLSSGKWPAWLNIAFGYSAENLYGGYNNRWIIPTGQTVQLDPVVYPRYSQFILSLDVDFTRIPTRNPFLKALFQGLNAFKFPFPGIEYNSLGKWGAHWIY
ncbi:MAG: DUF2279 domain-containing protein [Saprospiraceae bacterium]|nr:DUF2279 domain-containing protein [Saprospiraceae bacterium]